MLPATLWTVGEPRARLRWQPKRELMAALWGPGGLCARLPWRLRGGTSGYLLGLWSVCSASLATETSGDPLGHWRTVRLAARRPRGGKLPWLFPVFAILPGFLAPVQGSSRLLS